MDGQVVGDRQMLSSGGLTPLDVNAKVTRPQGPMAQGLQIFDLTEMAWNSRYDANAAPYTNIPGITEKYTL